MAHALEVLLTHHPWFYGWSPCLKRTGCVLWPPCWGPSGLLRKRTASVGSWNSAGHIVPLSGPARCCGRSSENRDGCAAPDYRWPDTPDRRLSRRRRSPRPQVERRRTGTPSERHEGWKWIQEGASHLAHCHLGWTIRPKEFPRCWLER